MKYVLLALVVGIGLFMLFGRNRGRGDAAAPAPPKPPPGPQAMLACTHCGVHLPQSDALMDVAGRPYCSDAHRIAGPR
jgi:uncharacterized protein